MRRFLLWLTGKLPPPRVIYDRNGRSPYLSRWYLIGDQHMVKPFGLYLHRFHRGDDEPELHNHPWRWAISLVLSGGYVEERRNGVDVVVARDVRPGTINFIRANDFHRVELNESDAWTLFLVGPRIQDWGFWERMSGKYTPWRDFINELRDPVAFRRTDDGYQEQSR